MHRFFAEKRQDQHLIIKDPVDVSHLKNVLRLKKGDAIEVVCEGILYHGVIDSIQQDVQVLITDEKMSDEKDFHLTLIQGLPKGQKTDEILKHGTEVGIDAFIITEMKRSVASGALRKKERFERILKDASKQSKSLFVPSIEFKALQEIDVEQFDQLFLLDEEERERSTFPSLSSKVALVVGPEGGIHEEERAYLKSRGAISISLGDRILRTEVAGVTTAYLLRYLKGTTR